LAQRSRKRGRRAKSQPRKAPVKQTPGVRPDKGAKGEPPPPPSVGGWRVEPQLTRSQRREAQLRAGLIPLGPGEHPGVIVAATIIAALVGVGQLIAFLAGLKIHGKTPAAGGTLLFCALLIACAVGMWRLWYGAVLGFMALLAIVATLFSLYLIEASNLLGLFVALAVIGGSGYLFFKLVRVLSRIQMPRYPGR
jgi:hypothetical protein